MKTNEQKLNPRGRTFTGTVVSMKMSKTITIEWQRRRFIPKYERYEKRRTRIHAHLPDGTDVKVGDLVKVMETRPISKTKNFIFIEKVADKKAVEKTVIKEVKKEKKNASN